jgi:hypothetical protein
MQFTAKRRPVTPMDTVGSYGTTGQLLMSNGGNAPPAFAATPGTAGQVLTSNGPLTAPTYQALPEDRTVTPYSGTTTAGYVTVFDLTDNNGLDGNFVLKNLDAANSLSMQVSWTDFFGNTDAGVSVLIHGTYNGVDFQASSPNGLFAPFKEIKVQVQNGSGACAYQAYLMHDT